MNRRGLGGCASRDLFVARAVVNVYRQKNQSSEPRARQPCDVPTVEPRPARSGWLQLRDVFHGRQRQRNNCAAVRATREVGERLLALVRAAGRLQRRR